MLQHSGSWCCNFSWSRCCNHSGSKCCNPFRSRCCNFSWSRCCNFSWSRCCNQPGSKCCNPFRSRCCNTLDLDVANTLDLDVATSLDLDVTNTLGSFFEPCINACTFRPRNITEWDREGVKASFAKQADWLALAFVSCLPKVWPDEDERGGRSSQVLCLRCQPEIWGH